MQEDWVPKSIMRHDEATKLFGSINLLFPVWDIFLENVIEGLQEVMIFQADIFLSSSESIMISVKDS